MRRRAAKPPLVIAFRRLALTLAAACTCSAQSPAAASVPPAAAAAATPPAAWCTSLPLPVDDAACRVLEVRAPRRTLRLAVAANEPKREHGLMNVATVQRGEGMLFAFADGDQTRYFWMKNTIAPLDMIFVDADGTVTSVAANVPATTPGTPDSKVATRQGAGRYVIELGAGDAKRQGIARGTHLPIPDIPAT